MATYFTSSAREAEVHALYGEVLKRWPVPSTHIRLATRQGETFVVACGALEAPPLLLLHGSRSIAAAWMSDAAAWSRQFRVYAVDLIGEPGFSAPSRPPLGDLAYSEWLDDVLDGLGVSRASFVARSLGGWLALDYASRRPERVERMALLCPAGVGRQKHFVLRAAVLALLGPRGLQWARRRVFGAPPGDLPAPERELTALMKLIGDSFRPRTQRIPRLDDAALAALAMPMLVMVGGRDLTIDSADTRRRIADHAPGAVVRFLPEAGHTILGQTEVILDFLRNKTA